MAMRLPISFFAPMPGVWQLFFWGAFSLLGLLVGVGALLGPDPNFGGALVGLLMSGLFIGIGVATWLERRRRKQPALVITSEGLSFWPGSRKEKFLPWIGLKETWVLQGDDPQIVFQPTDLRRFGSRTLLFFRAGPSLPLKTATKDGVKVTDVLEAFSEQTHFKPLQRARERSVLGMKSTDSIHIQQGRMVGLIIAASIVSEVGFVYVAKITGLSVHFTGYFFLILFSGFLGVYAFMPYGRYGPRKKLVFTRVIMYLELCLVYNVVLIIVSYVNKGSSLFENKAYPISVFLSFSAMSLAVNYRGFRGTSSD